MVIQDIFLIIACILSMSGSSVMVIYYFFRGLRNNTSQKLICYMSMSDLIFSTSNLFYGISSNGWECKTQAYFLQFSELSTFTLCFMLMVCIYMSVIKNRQDLLLYKKWFIILGFFMPALLSLIPLIRNEYGNNGLGCGYRPSQYQDLDRGLTIAEALLFFYIPLWIFSILNLYLISRVANFIYKLKIDRRSKSMEQAEDKEIELSYNIIQNMFAYPIIMMICWFPFTIHQIAQLGGTRIKGLEYVMYLLPDLIGSMNAIVYYINVRQFKKWEQINKQENQHQLAIVRQNRNQQESNMGSFISDTVTDYHKSYDY